MVSFWKGWLQRLTVSLGVLSLTAGGGLAAIDAAQAAVAGSTTQVVDANLSWRVNDESGGGAYFGGCNFLVAGTVGDNGASSVWSAAFADKYYQTTNGRVTITKPDAAGNQVAPTWTNKCQGPDGKNVNTKPGSTSGNQVNFTGGSGTINAAKNDAQLEFEGSFTIVYYGGMTYWSISNPKLTVVDGRGKLTGTASGYGADMFNPEKWVELPPTQIELATMQHVEVTDTGIRVTPDYEGVAVDVKPDGPSGEQLRTKDGWGSFPQSWVDFNVLTGQAAYWYSSGGMVDLKKPAAPLEISYVEKTEPYAAATPSRVAEGADAAVQISIANVPAGVTGEIAVRANGEWLATADGKMSMPVTDAAATGMWRVGTLAAGVHSLELFEVEPVVETEPTTELSSTPDASTDADDAPDSDAANEAVDDGSVSPDAEDGTEVESSAVSAVSAATGAPVPSSAEPIAVTQLAVVGGVGSWAPLNLEASAVRAGGFGLRWNWPGEVAPDYRVEVFEGTNTSGAAVKTLTVPDGMNSTDVSGLQNGTQYTVVVTPVLNSEALWRAAELTVTTSKQQDSGGDGNDGGKKPPTPSPDGDSNDTSKGATLYWGLNVETNGGAYFGGCNFLVAGRTGDAGSSRVWLASEADKLYRAQDGNVSIVKPQGSQLELATWKNKCLDRNGDTVSVQRKGSHTESQVKLSNGSVVKNDESGVRVEWQGSFTVVFYGGMTYWSATDPVLELDPKGNGKLTAVASGYGASMQDASKWVELKSRTITLANLTGVNMASLRANGVIEHTPDYLGVVYSGTGDSQEIEGGDGSASATKQVPRTSENAAYWGSFPSDFVDFQNETGQFSYWFTSNGQRDPYKPTLPMTLSLQGSFVPSLGDYEAEKAPSLTKPNSSPKAGSASSAAAAQAPAAKTAQTRTGAEAAQQGGQDTVALAAGGDAELEVTPTMLMGGGAGLLSVAGLQWAVVAFLRQRLGLDPSAYI